MQALINPNGTGRLFMNTGVAPFHWEACTPDLSECKKFHGGHDISTSGVAAGTVLRVKDGVGARGLSPEWKGRLKQVAPPSVAGPIEANRFVSPVPGEWSGGWAGEGAQMQLSACATPTGEECISLTSLHYVRPCPASSSFAIEPQFAGRFLRVADNQPGAGPIVEPAFGVLYPSGEEAWAQRRATSVAIVGQIAASTGGPIGECGPPPSPRARLSAEGDARVECPAGCVVSLRASHQGRKVSLTRRIPRQDLRRPEAALELRLAPSKLLRLGGRKVDLVVVVDGSRLAHRSIEIPVRPGKPA
jgi:hypothetical protein